MAYMAGGRLSYALPDVVGAPKITAIYEQSSGEKCGGAPEDTTGCAGDDSRAFFPFFGRNHFYRGVGDQVGGINARDIGAGLSAEPVKQLALSATWHHFQLVEPEGAWYRNNGAIVGWEPGNSEAALGHEIDLLATYKPIKQVFLQGAVIWFKPVGVGERLAGPGSTLSSYLWLVVSL